MNKLVSTGILIVIYIMLGNSCGNFQEDTNLSDDKKVAQGVGYIEDGKVVVNDLKGKEISFEKKDEMITEFSDYENTKYPLVGKLEEADISLYADKESGAILVKGEFVQYLDLGVNGFFAPRGILPEIHTGDYDNDSKSEIAIVLYLGSGTGVSFEELYVLDDDEAYEECYKVLALSNLEYSNKLQEALSFKVGEGDIVTLKVANKDYDLGSIEGFTGLGCGSIAYFLIEGEDISIVSKLGVSTTEVSTDTLYEGTGWIRAKVMTNGKGFEFSDVVYVENEEYNPIDEKEQKFLS